MEYIRISEGLDNYKLYPKDVDLRRFIEKAGNKDYYFSIYTYEDKHYEHWKQVGNLRGIRDVKTDKLVWDFDDVDNIENARKQTLETIGRLVNKGFNKDDIQIYFSGNRGFHLMINLDEKIDREQFEDMVFGLASGLDKLDKTVKDQQRLIRMPFTKNPKTKLYDIPIELRDLEEQSITQIKELASELDQDSWDLYQKYRSSRVALPESMRKLKKPDKETKKEEIQLDGRLELHRKPKWLSATKFALQEGFFVEGERNTAFMILAATYKANGFSQRVSYGMLKAVAEDQAKRTGGDKFPKEELWNNIIKQVYSTDWQGGTYSQKETDLLRDVAERFNLNPDDGNRQVVDIVDIETRFEKFAKEFEKNRITTGIERIDENVLITTGMQVGILGSPGSGKTSYADKFTKHLSKKGQHVLFESLDMSDNFMYCRSLQSYTGYDFKKTIELVQKGIPDKKLLEAMERVREDYKNVRYNFRSGTNVEDIENDIIHYKSKIGDELKLVVVDYLEKVRGPYSDATANSGYVASRLSDLATEYDIALLLLLQPQKSAGDPSEPLLSMRKAKGASVIEQDCRMMMTMWREGFNPKTMEDDKFASIAVVKNNMGELCQLDFHWTGVSGTLRELTNDEAYELSSLRERKAEEKRAAQNARPF